MSRPHSIARHAAIAFALVSAAACSTNRSVPDQISDATLTTQVKAKIIADAETNPFSIDVDTLDGVVSLRGVVDEPDDRAKAERLARETRGVVRVVNEIKLGDEVDPERSANDATVTARVKTRLAGNSVVEALDIDVDTLEGVVTMSGIVDSEQERMEAERTARATPGVRSVHNELQVHD